jgi:L-rhamnose mutarotase
MLEASICADMAQNTERAVYVQRIDPDRREEYVDAHEDVPEEVIAAMERGTVTEFDLYVRGDVVVCLLEARDLDRYLNAVTGDPAVEEWEQHVAQFKREGVDVNAPADKQIPFMDRIWSFRSEGE